MPSSRIDHLVITAPSLEVGAEYVRDTLGVAMQAGGEHPRMGTHNLLVKLGDDLFLEVIAINPDAPAPERSRWFELDGMRANQPPRLATWVVRTDDIRMAVATSPVATGSVEPMSRGDLNWFISIPEDGSLPLQGIAPTLIQWQVEVPPARSLSDSGCSLVRLEGFHPEAERVDSMLASIGFQGEFSVSGLMPGKSPYLVAHIQTSAGVRELRG
jgi:hypothetical protein